MDKTAFIIVIKIAKRLDTLKKIATNDNYLGHGEYKDESFYDGYTRALADVEDELKVLVKNNG